MFIRKPKNKQLGNIPDEKLIALFLKTKDVLYFNELYSRHVHNIYYACLGILKDRGKSKDMVMRIFDKVWRKLPAQSIHSSFSNWLFTLVKNECRDLIRREASLSKKETEWKKVKLEEAGFMENETVLRQYFKEEQKNNQIIEDAVSSLNKQQRLCIRYFFYEKKSYKEIAALTAFSIKEVKSHLQNGKKNLRRLVSEQLSKNE